MRAVPDASRRRGGVAATQAQMAATKGAPASLPGARKRQPGERRSVRAQSGSLHTFVTRFGHGPDLVTTRNGSQRRRHACPRRPRFSNDTAATAQGSRTLRARSPDWLSEAPTPIPYLLQPNHPALRNRVAMRQRNCGRGWTEIRARGRQSIVRQSATLVSLPDGSGSGDVSPAHRRSSGRSSPPYLLGGSSRSRRAANCPE